ncbi:MAG: hypothetical protein ABFS46_17715 [Myxococcota bacterium]
MRILAIASLLSFALVGSAVGVRLVLLARRTRRLPELSIGLGLLLICALGHPFCALGRLPGMLGTPLGDGLFALGLGLSCTGIALLYCFTWRVFRVGESWARTLVIGAALTLALLAVGLLRASSHAETLSEILPLTRPWAVGIVLAVTGAFAWTGAESFAHARRLQRRLALGLADPVVLDRFRLWGTSGLAGAALCSTLAVCLGSGMMVLHEPVPLAITAAAGWVVSICWTLAFLPPAQYLRSVERRAQPALRTS